MKYFGKYVVASGVDLKVRPTHHSYRKFFVLDETLTKCHGNYDDEMMAEGLADFLDKADRKKLADEMDKILRS